MRFLVLAPALLLVGCAGLAPVPVPDEGLAACQGLFAKADSAVDGAGVRDAQQHRPAGFPYLRASRFLASFAEQVQPAQLETWLGRMRALDRQARAIELANLNQPAWGEAQLEALDFCASRWMVGDLKRPERIAALRRAVQVPDDYSLLARALGLYPLALPFLHLGVEAYRDGVITDFARPLAELAAEGDWQRWRVQGASSASAADSPTRQTDGLGVPVLAEVDQQQLLSQHAPEFLIDTRGDFDQPGRPLPSADFVEMPVVYQRFDWTRFYGEILPQLTYTVWFSQRPADGTLDPYAGSLDGVMWRVTLDAAGKPLIYDTAHSCGCYHYVFPARDLARRPGSFWQEQPLQPQGQLPWPEVSVVLGSGDHYVRRVIPRTLGIRWSGRPVRELVPRDYDSLRSMEDANGRSASLFGPTGLIDGSQRLERYWLWPSGVPDPGAMRQWGRHATAFIGRAHFDDPFALERWFLAP